MIPIVQRAFILLAIFATSSTRLGAAELKLYLPLGRTAYQCNERIALTVLRSSRDPLPAGDLLLTLSGDDGSQLAFTFAEKQVEASGGQAQGVEHLQVNGWLLRPGAYRVEVACDGASARTNLTVHSHVRRSDFKLINWGRAKGRDQLAQGEDSLGFNLFYGGYAADDEANFIRAGVDFMGCCVMGGGHQMDLRQECDWSDPYVVRGGTRRVVKRAFIDRTRPNVWGVHFYDEPGLTWTKDPETGEMNPHAVPWQLRSYEAAYGEPPLDWKKVDPRNPAHVARWAQWARWKLGLMDAAWQDAQFGISAVKPEYLSVTQSQYGYSAFSDGYYFNVVRSLPVISGHGGYHDFGPGYFNPSMFLEFARAHDLSRPNWYLPTWYSSTTADEFRLEQYLSFQCGLQGTISPPDIEPGGAPEKSKAAQGVVESNHLLQRLGPIFNTMPPTRPPVALLFSLSQFLYAQTFDRKVCYAHDTAHGRNLMFAYLAGKLLQHQFLPLLEEDILDGTLAAQHKAVILTSLDYLDPDVIAALENFIKAGGLVLLTADSTVQVRGAGKLDIAPAWPDADKIAQLKKAGQNKEAGELTKMRQALAGAKNLAESIRPQLERAGITPPLASTEPGIVVTRHVTGDVEYLFAVNATHDPDGSPMLGVKAATTTLRMADFPNAPFVYDAVHGGQTGVQGAIRFGPGQMRVFARLARPIGGVMLAAPVVHRNYTALREPLRVEFAASVFSAPPDSFGYPQTPHRQAGGGARLLSGSIPLRIVVTDPLDTMRYDLYRATDCGSLKLSLPLTLNDPPGDWRITVTELLANTRDTVTFRVPVAAPSSAAAGTTWRAVHWPEDRAKVFRFFRTHQHVTLVKGTSDFNNAAAERLEKILIPWNVTCSILTAAEANKPRALTEEEARTWIGLDYAGRGQIKPGTSNSPVAVGFAVQGPVVLLGAPADNPLIKFVADQRFLPYRPDSNAMPGPGRGYVAWQREAIGVNQETITLIAFDADGMNEAVGTLYEMLAGLEPLTPLAPPRTSAITPASRVEVTPELAVDWSIALPDRITGLRAADGQLSVLTHAATLSEVSAAGKAVSTKVIRPAEYANLVAQLQPATDAAAIAEARKSAPAGRLVKLVAKDGDQTAVAYWGGTVSVLGRSGACKASSRLPQDITALAWLGPKLVVGDADGRVVALKP